MLAWNGFDYNAPKRLLKIHPKRMPRTGPFKGFWSSGTGWGDFLWTRDSVEVRVTEGRLAVDAAFVQAVITQRRPGTRASESTAGRLR